MLTKQIKWLEKSQRPILLTVTACILLSWYYLVFEMAMNMSPVLQWDAFDIFMLFVMWAIMMAGMMLPSAIPVIMLVSKMNKQRQTRRAPYTHAFYFIVGYLLVWMLYCAVITFTQYWLHRFSLLTPMMVSAMPGFSALLLIVAGIYQWTGFKQRCLQYCRSPLSLFSTKWKEGITGAINLGFLHGQYCLGCCWVLMALLFVAGVMSLKWILALTILVLIEKIMPMGDQFSRIVGVCLVLLGFGVLL
ncbi:DUF2182 domain-containing protein [Hahella ganghwensis]|uniref:DUF2182 domain-containing protein n=1 Tax=Hahella ganghwensis TaxID=286420 RepID=UPI000399AB1A|nr:DUF2182 domain-containing protein [Hahella ganghwensis]